MSRFVLRGGERLSGELTAQGAKNSVLPILAATILSRGVCVLRRCPRLRDVEVSLEILRYIGAAAEREGDSLLVDTSGVCRRAVPDALMRETRSSAIFLGAILGRCGSAELSYPGGCELGPRPIDLHLRGLRQLGAEIREEGGTLLCRGGKLRGTDIVLALPSVGATENLMLAACAAEGTTRVLNAAREPEIVDLQAFLRACGARVTGAGTSTVTVEGGAPLHGAEHTVMPDRITAATYLCAAASAGGDVTLRDIRPEELATVTDALTQAGCAVERWEDSLRLRAEGPLRAIPPIRTAPYPGFPTDTQAILMAALLRARGATVFEENIFENRYRHVDELARMGADIRTSGRVAVASTARRCAARTFGAGRPSASRPSRRRDRPRSGRSSTSSGATRTCPGTCGPWERRSTRSSKKRREGTGPWPEDTAEAAGDGASAFSISSLPWWWSAPRRCWP